ncbi:choice-of-anchor D domain-containing protein [Bernardetia sp. Wsw4-3y2]|uniref:Ig-like domain-containing protein n=1 Tax=Bernardetia sp. Wsw4-3y2 TaxID=3127471 RepID=UPI0030D2B47E
MNYKSRFLFLYFLLFCLTHWQICWQNVKKIVTWKILLTTLVYFVYNETYAQVPSSVLSPVSGTNIRIGSNNGSTPIDQWTFNQHQSGGHLSGGVGGANDRYAWDVNRGSALANADRGQNVYAVADGVIRSSGMFGSWGGNSSGQLLIEHTNPNGTKWYSAYLHVDFSISKVDGTPVDANTLLGTIGRIGANNDHLHFVTYNLVRNQLISTNAQITARVNTTLYLTAEMKFYDYPLSNYETPLDVWVRGQVKQFEAKVRNTSSSTISRWLQLTAIDPDGTRLVVWNNSSTNVSIRAGETYTVTLTRTLRNLIDNITRSGAGDYTLVLEGGLDRYNLYQIASLFGGNFNPHGEDVVIEDPNMDVSQALMRYPSYSSFQNRSIDANVIVDYEVSDPWITVTPSSSVLNSGTFYGRNNSLKINVAQNISNTQRGGTIKLTEYRIPGSSEYNLPEKIVRTIPVLQEGRVQNDPAEMQITNMRLESSAIPANGANWQALIDNLGDQTMEWEVSTYLNNAGVPTVVNPSSGNLSGGGTRNLNVWIPENTTTSSREWEITFENREAAPTDPNRFKTFIYIQEGSVPILTAARLDVRNAPNESRRIAASGESFRGIYVNNIGQQLMDWSSATTLNGSITTNVVNPSSGTNLRAGGFTEIAFDFPPNTTSNEIIWEIEIENEEAAPNDPERLFRRRYIQEATVTLPPQLEVTIGDNEAVCGGVSTIFADLNGSTQKTIKIKNTGASTLIIDNVTIGGDFSTSMNSFSIAPNGEIIEHLTFAPTQTGQQQQILSFTSNANSCDITVYGNARTPYLSVKVNGELSDCGSTIDFSPIPVNTIDFKQINLENTGNATLNISSVTITGGEFTTNQGTIPPLAQGDQDNFDVHFRPTRVGVQTAVLRIESDDPNNPICEFTITAEATSIIVPPLSDLIFRANDVTSNQNEVEQSYTLEGDNTPLASYLTFRATYTGVTEIVVLPSLFAVSHRIVEIAPNVLELRAVVSSTSGSTFGLTSGDELLKVKVTRSSTAEDCIPAEITRVAAIDEDRNRLDIESENGTICKPTLADITVRVKTADGKPVNNTRVIVEGQTYTTNANGEVVLPHLLDTEFSALVEKDNFTTPHADFVEILDIAIANDLVIADEGEFSSFIKIAGDVNKDNENFLEDIDMIINAFFGDTFPWNDTPDWVFTTIDAATNPFSPRYAEGIPARTITENTTIEVTAIALGDLDFEYARPTDRIEILPLYVERKVEKLQNEEYKVSFITTNTADVEIFSARFEGEGKELTSQVFDLKHRSRENKLVVLGMDSNGKDRFVDENTILLSFITKNPDANVTSFEYVNENKIPYPILLKTDSEEGEERIDEIVIFPNPNKGNFFIQSPEVGFISITDATGRAIFETEIEAGKNQITIPNAAKGMYNLIISSPSFSTVKKIVIE